MPYTLSHRSAQQKPLWLNKIFNENQVFFMSAANCGKKVALKMDGSNGNSNTKGVHRNRNKLVTRCNPLNNGLHSNMYLQTCNLKFTSANGKVVNI